jgi:hypothetical protein
MDDTHVMVFGVFYRKREQALRHLNNGMPIPGLEIDAQNGRPEPLPATDGWHGRWLPKSNRSNDYNIDRVAQRTTSFTGISSVPIQDQAMTESMGEIVDRSLEHLMSSDVMISRTRRALLKAARHFQQTGETPRLVREPGIGFEARSGAFITRESGDWRQIYEEQLRSAPRPAQRDSF